MHNVEHCVASCLHVFSVAVFLPVDYSIRRSLLHVVLLAVYLHFVVALIVDRQERRDHDGGNQGKHNDSEFLCKRVHDALMLRMGSSSSCCSSMLRKSSLVQSTFR